MGGEHDLAAACQAARDLDELALVLSLFQTLTGAVAVGLEAEGWRSGAGAERLPLGQGAIEVGALLYTGGDADAVRRLGPWFGPSLAALIARRDHDQHRLELTTLQKLAQATAASLDLDVVLGRCLDLTTTLSGASGVTVHLHDEGRYVLASMRGVPASVVLKAFPDELIAGIFDADPVKFDSRFSDLLASGENHPSLTGARAAGLERLMVLPLHAEGRRIGILSLFFAQPDTFSPSMMATVIAVAQQQAAFIANARAHRVVALRGELAQRLSEFAERALSMVDVPVLEQLVLDTALSITGSDRGLLAVVEFGSCRVVCGAGVDKPLIGLRLPVGSTYLPEALASTKPFVVENTATLDPTSAIGALANNNGTGSFVLTAMRRHDMPVGLLFVASPEPRRYGIEELEALSLLASMSAEARERCLAAEHVEAERRILSATIEHLPIIVTILSRDEPVMVVNAAGRTFNEEFLNASDRWDVGLAQMEAFRPGETTPIPTAERVPFRAFRGEVVPPTELILRNERGARMPALAVAAPIVRDANGDVLSVVVAFFDVTRLRELVEEKDRFLRMASHELRSPITSLRATTHLLEMDPLAISDPERRRTLLGRAQRQIDRLIKLVEQLIDGARLGGELPIDAKECDLCQVVTEGVELAIGATSSLPSRVRLELPPSLLGVWDAGHLEQAVVNLVSNALRYSGSREVTVVASDGGATATLRVIDHGIGIPDDAVEKIFRPFFRAANATQVHKGLGLGMHITSEIVRRHRGRIEVTSTLGVGTVFTVILPKQLP